MARNFDELRAKMKPENRAAVDARVKEAITALPLDYTREARSMTQTQLAEILRVSEGMVSTLERRADMYISTLRSYISAMGGSLQIRAIFPDGEVVINQFQDLEK